jgi:chromosome segregation protein
MKFVRLRLQGFKSFVDATELAIAPGLTGVVGPNGCGKSNLLEALRWVMGESSAKAMRGGGMDDVIFAGSAARSARPWAEVALTLDNGERRAPVGFNDADQIEVARRITRELGSSYRVNGREARARDVRMLFADAATGAHSPALVRQGRIAELIAAKPVARRAILEEAAGVSGLHQRRREAELKLDAAARNLLQVDDTLDALTARLGQLTRQAREAKRYREIAEALRRAELALLFARWREADAARAAADAALTEAARAAAEARGAAAQAAAARLEAEAAAPPAREEAQIAAAVAQRATLEKSQLETRAAEAAAAVEAAAQRLAQLQADAEREAALNADAAETMARLDAEMREIEGQRAGHDDALAAAQAAAAEASARLAEAEAQLDAAAEEAARAAAVRAAAERRMAETRAAADKARRAAAEAAEAAERLAADLPALAARAEADAEAQAEAEAAAEAADEACAEAEAARAVAQTAEGAARGAAAEAAGEASALRAETQGLERLLAKPAGAAGAILEQVRAAPGYEAALGAALGEDLGQPEAQGDGSGWAEVPPLPAEAPPAGAEPMAAHVAAPARLARRLARVAVVADRAAGDAAQGTLAPGWRLVSRDGDLWRWDGLRLRAGAAPSAAAARLAQKNRLDALTAALAEAEARAAEAEAAHRAARDALAEAAGADAAAREGRRRADEAAAAAARAAGQSAAALTLAEGRIESAEAARAARAEDAAAAAEAEEEAAEALADGRDPAEARAAADNARAAAETLRAQTAALRAQLDEVRRRDAGRERRLAAAAKERATWAGRLANAEKRRDELAARIARAEIEAERADAAPGEIAAALARVSAALTAADARRAAADAALAAAEAALKQAEAAERAAERAASEAGEARARREALLEAEAARAAEAEDRLREIAPAGPASALEALGDAPLEDVEAAEIEVAKLRRQRDALGAVNLRAEEDAAEVETERGKLAADKADLEAAIAKLRQGVSELNREGRARLLAAFDQVNETFKGLFTHLFNGGEASLTLVESDDPLEAGLEIMAMPPGKKLGTLSLLSGGEQTLTALALIFAVFLVNPAPVCVLDEVDAPLDDSNVGRFCDLLDEMTRRTDTRFLVITHNPVTMSRMDRLFGVTMVEQGVSQLVSVDLVLAAEMVG